MFRNNSFMVFSIVLVTISATISFSCTNNMDDVNNYFSEELTDIEQAHNVELLYSDSAEIKVRVTSPLMVRNLDRIEPKDEFPEGLHAEFFGPNMQVTSWMDAKFATRYEKDGRIIAEDSVVIYNRKNEKLSTPYLIWNEKEETLENNQFVMITRPDKQDTLMGFGIIANQDFTRFEIKKRLTGKSKMEQLTKVLSE